MKIVLIVLGVIALIFVIAQFVISRNVSNTEQHQYEVLKDYGDFEVRRYEPALFTSVVLNAEGYSQTSTSGFRTLAGYIFGGNEKNQKIAMTSPVVMEFNDQTTMRFMVPSGMDQDELPKPDDERIHFEAQEEKVMAAIRFGGWADDAKIAAYRDELKSLLDANNLVYTGPFQFLGYSPPFEMANRRNEVVVELKNFPPQ